MSVTFETIFLHLKNNIVDWTFTKESKSIELTQARLITKSQKDFKSNTVYVGTSSFVNKNQIDLAEANLILINDLEPSSDINLASANAYVVLTKECDLFEQFNLINNVFNHYIKLDSMRDSDDMHQVAYKAADLLENPVIFIDSSYKVLAYSKNYPTQDQIWKENIERGYCSYEFISYVRNMEKVKNSLHDSSPFLLTCYKSNIPKYALKFFVGGKLMGYMIVLIEDKAFNAAEKELAMEISTIAASSYKKTLSQSNLENLGYENLLMDLLDHKITDSKTLDEKKKIYNESFSDQMVIMLLDISAFDPKKKVAGYLSREIDRILNKRHIYYKNKIVVLYDFQDRRFNQIKEIKSLQAFANTNKIIIAVSHVFTELIQARTYYLQAKKALALKEKIQFPDSLLQFEEVGFYVFLDEAKEQRIEAEEYVHPSLDILLAYDRENQTDLYTTLYTYLNKNQNAVSTGNQLFLHRNTVKYRIDKIIEITGLDLADQDQVFNLLFSYRVKAHGRETNKII